MSAIHGRGGGFVRSTSFRLEASDINIPRRRTPSRRERREIEGGLRGVWLQDVCFVRFAWGGALTWVIWPGRHSHYGALVTAQKGVVRLTGGISFATFNSPFTTICRTKCCNMNQLR